MSKFVSIIAGAAEIGAGLFLEYVTFGASTPLTAFLISSGVGMVLSGIGTLLSQGPVAGTTTASRNPIKPWDVVYGRAKVGGTLVFVNPFGENDKYLDMVFALACHPSRSVDALLLNGVRVRLDANGCSFEPTQQTVNIVSIVRAGDTVTVTVDADITDLQTGDSIIVENVWDHTFNGRFAVTVQSPTVFTYISGGLPNNIANSGQVVTTWPNYKAKIHMEVLLGNHTATFPGMLNGTPYDGDPTNLVVNDNNPWGPEMLLLGRTSVFLRLHYNDQIFTAGLPTFAFRLSGMTGIYDPREEAGTVLARPTVTLNGWGPNQHVGAYEEGQDQATNWGLDSGTTSGYANPGNACDASVNTPATCVMLHTHQYAGCIWSFAALTATPSALYLSVRSAVNGESFTGRSAGIWYSLDGGSTWTMLYNAVDRPEQWDNIQLSTSQDCSKIQVMAFADAHDDIGHSVFDIRLGTEPASSGDGYTENAALCIADFLSNPTFGFRANYGTEIPTAMLIAAANICDEQVPLAEGGTEPRYACNGTFNLQMKRGDILQNMLTSCAGRLTYVGGTFNIYPGAWPGVSFVINRPIASATLYTLTSHTGTSSGDVGLINFAASIAGESMIDDNSSWTLRTDSYSFPGGLNWAQLNALELWFRDFGTLGYAGPPNATFAIYDCWLVVTFADGSTQTLRPTQAQAYNAEIGHVLNVDNAIDGDQTTCATITRTGFGPLVDYTIDSIILSGFAVATSTETNPDTSASSLQASGMLLSSASGPIRWRPKLSVHDLYNGVKGTYISPANNWQAADIPPYAQDSDHGYSSGSPEYPLGDANLAADGGTRRWLDIQLPFTISCPASQRLAKIELMRRRQQQTLTLAFNLSMYQATALDIIALTLPVLGFVQKLFEITAFRFTQTKQSDGAIVLGTEIDIQETDPSIYDWSTTEELNPQDSQQGSGSTSSTPTISYVNYSNAPAIALSQPSATSISVAATAVTFPTVTLNYNARTISIPDPGATPTWYYVTIADPNYTGDADAQSPLVVYAETTNAKVGAQSFIYLGAILCTHAAGASATPLAGGWPAPPTFLIGD